MGNLRPLLFQIFISCFLRYQEVVGQGDSLFLTPLINVGSIEEARALSKVGTLPFSGGLPERDSYSGFITVNEQYDSNLFFWFFPALNSPETAPLILWLDGGPGVSSFMTIFSQNGPYVINAAGNLEERQADWTVNNSVIYLENPVGVGYSFTRDPAGLSTTSEEAAINSMEFLRQFFLLFPELTSAPFYAVGESFGGHLIPPLATLIHDTNQGTNQKINLKGILLYCPWTKPIVQLKSGYYLYNIGLIDEATLADFEAQEAKMIELINQEEFSAATDVFNNLIFLPGSTFENATGFTSPDSVLVEHYKPEDYLFIPYALTPEFRLAVHAGNVTYTDFDIDVLMAFHAEKMTSKASYVERLLNATEGYKVTIVSGQMDMLVTHTGVEALVDGLNWDGSVGMKNTTRDIWRVDAIIAGYVRSFSKLTYIFMRNVGHFPIMDKANWNLVLLECVLDQEGCELTN